MHYDVSAYFVKLPSALDVLNRRSQVGISPLFGGEPSETSAAEEPIFLLMILTDHVFELCLHFSFAI
jgi:hypothetical protein